MNILDDDHVEIPVGVDSVPRVVVPDSEKDERPQRLRYSEYVAVDTATAEVLFKTNAFLSLFIIPAAFDRYSFILW